MAKASHNKKDKKISIVVKGSGEDESGYPIPNPPMIPIPGGENIWAYYRHASADEFFAAAGTNYKVEVVFEIRWRNDIKNTMKVIFRGKQYDITRIDDFEGYKENLKIYAYSIN